jgi:hypothetical protein
MNIRKAIEYKPSKAINFMVNGLERQSKRKEFQIDMDTFGYRDSVGICYGCAVSCALQELFQKDYTQNTDIKELANRCNFFNCDDYNELHYFEVAIDSVRLGSLHSLFTFCFGELTNEQKKYCDKLLLNLPELHTDNWENELPIYKMLIHTLETNGY